MSSRIVAPFVVSLLLVAGCRSHANGEAEGRCYADGTCKPGLHCSDGTCKEVDCDRVAARLASLELGNYAPRDQVDAYRADAAARCEAAGLARADAECILGASLRAELADCANPMLALSQCDRVAAQQVKLGGSGRSGDRAHELRYFVSQCDQLSAEQRACILGAATADDYARCQP